LPGILPVKSVSRGRAFRQHIHVLAKRHRHPCRCPLRGLSTPTHRRTETPVEQRAILARTRCATAALLRERGAAAKGTSSIGQIWSVSKGSRVAVSGWMESVRVVGGSTPSPNGASGSRAALRPQVLYRSSLGHQVAKKYWPRIDSSIEGCLGEK
jgi:hypothetical protein